MATAQADRGVPLSTLCPKFLHTNSTSHTGPFSAIAELIDNAYDPDVSADQIWVDKTVVKGEECLSFMDNGNGLNHDTMHKMLSFGYSDKTTVNGKAPIGIYGNGFKSGSMRLGRDAIVFSKSKTVSCVGMLSQTYLKEINANQIIVPIICFEHTKGSNFSVKEEHKSSLQDILLHSPFKTQEELLTELNIISSSWSTGKTGTRIIIWNLRRTSTGSLEFDFEKDRYDIRIPSDIYEATAEAQAQANPQTKSYIPETACSLQAYCSVLYLKPRMQIIIRGQKVRTQLIAKSLASTRKDYYKPNFLNKAIPLIFGYNPKSKDQYGIMMYHKNRLIKAYERVGCQLKANKQGVGVIGIIECDFLDPTHNKQDFNLTDQYRKTMHNVELKLEDYCKEISFRWSKDNPNSTGAVEDTMKRPDQNWVQCGDCLKWRKLPDGIDISKLPDKWCCHENPDPQFRSCQVEQEPEDSDDDQQPYRKTYKQQEKEKKKQQKKKEKDNEEQRRQEEQRLTNIAKQNERLKRRQQDLERQLRQRTVNSPPTPTTPRSGLRTESLQGGAASAESSPLISSSISQAACSPSSNSGLPVISDVYSLKSGSARGKRTQPASPLSTPKRSRLSVRRNIRDTPSAVNVSQFRLRDDTDSDTDDDIVILESASTPKPKNLEFDVTKVKKEPETSDANDSMLLECSEDAAVDDDAAAGTSSNGSTTARTSPSPAPAPEITSTTTQTERPTVKMEKESQNEMEDMRTVETSTSDLNGNEQSARGTEDVCGAEQRAIKQESQGERDVQSDNAEECFLHRGGTLPHVKSDEEAGPSNADAFTGQLSPPLSSFPTFTEVQEQQDHLLELMQQTAQERDCFKERVDELTNQLQDAQNRLQEMCQRNDSEPCHQDSQTEETHGGDDYKSLFEKAKRKVDELIEDKQALLAAVAEANKHNGQSEEGSMDELLLHVDSLMRDIDQRQKENDDLRSQLECLTEEKANLAAQCEELRLSLQQQQQKEDAQGVVKDSSVQPSVSGTNSDTFRSLIELRQNIGRFLITRMPALDLDQVNYECNVIDEILEQFLSGEELTGAQGDTDEVMY